MCMASEWKAVHELAPFLFALCEASGFMRIMCTYIMSVRNNQLEHLKAVLWIACLIPWGVPCKFPSPLRKNIILSLFALVSQKKPENPAHMKRIFFSKKHSCKCSVGEWTSKLFPILISVFEHGEGSLCLRGLPYSCSIVHLRVPCDCGAKLCWWMLLAS